MAARSDGAPRKPGADDVGDPELTLAVPDEADQGPRLPRGRQRAGIGQAPEGGNEVGRLGFIGTSESGQKCVEAGVHRESRLGRTPCGEDLRVFVYIIR